MSEKLNLKKRILIPDIQNTAPTFSWESPDFVLHPRSAKSYLIIIGGALLVSGFMYSQQIWTGLALVLFALAYIIFTGRQKPKNVTCALYDQGVVVDGKVYAYEEFKSFWTALGDIPKIKLQLVGRFAGQVSMPVADHDLDTVSKFLIEHLPEEEDKGEDLVDVINRMIKF
jgi:hypothetical protein